MGKGTLAAALAALALLAIPGFASARIAPAPHARSAHTQPAPIRPFIVYGVSNKYQRTALVKAGYDIGERAWANHVELFGTASQAIALTASGYNVVPERIPAHTWSPTPDDFPPGDSAYHNYAEMVADVQAFAAAHPTLAHIFSLGQSFEGRDLIGVRISDDATDNLSEPGVFYVAQHHAREHLTVEVVLNMMHMFLEKPQLSDLVHTRQIYIVPSLNPDGSEWDIHTGQYLFWRKNRQPPDGTDQNRNYSYRWGCCGGSDSDQYGETYRGPNAFSTPEDVAMRDFIEAHPNIHTGISFHSNAALILYPYGYTYADIPQDMSVHDHDTFVAMGRVMHATVGYPAVQSSDLYITDGDWNDWMYGQEYRFPFTIELGGNSFYPGPGLIPIESARVQRAVIFDAEVADCPPRVAGYPLTQCAADHQPPQHRRPDLPVR
jgi:carboxypeptidase T